MAVDGWLGCAAAVAGADFYQTTATLTLPTLVIASDRDGSTPPDLVREAGDLIRGSRFALIRGAGHFPMIEAPAAYAEVLTDFLRGIGHV
jgi:3-oxoadipate enol-lactonase